MADVKNHSTLTTSLVSYWELEETSGTRVDSHGSNDLTDNNTVTSGTGIQGTCADFEVDNSEYLSITDASQSGLDLTGDLSFNFWFKPETQDGVERHVVAKFQESGNHRAYTFSYTANGASGFLRLTADDNGTAPATSLTSSNTTINSGTWYMATLTYDASAGTAKFYLDASQIGSNVTGGPTSIHNGGADFRISGTADGSGLVDGLIDEVGVWSKILTTSEISDLYNSGSGIPYEEVSTFTPKFIGII